MPHTHNEYEEKTCFFLTWYLCWYWSWIAIMFIFRINVCLFVTFAIYGRQVGHRKDSSIEREWEKKQHSTTWQSLSLPYLWPMLPFCQCSCGCGFDTVHKPCSIHVVCRVFFGFVSSFHLFKTVKWKTFDVFPRGLYTPWFSCLLWLEKTHLWKFMVQMVCSKR